MAIDQESRFVFAALTAAVILAMILQSGVKKSKMGQFHQHNSVPVSHETQYTRPPPSMPPVGPHSRDIGHMEEMPLHEPVSTTQQTHSVPHTPIRPPVPAQESPPHTPPRSTSVARVVPGSATSNASASSSSSSSADARPRPASQMSNSSAMDDVEGPAVNLTDAPTTTTTGAPATTDTVRPLASALHGIGNAADTTSGEATMDEEEEEGSEGSEGQPSPRSDTGEQEVTLDDIKSVMEDDESQQFEPKHLQWLERYMTTGSYSGGIIPGLVPSNNGNNQCYQVGPLYFLAHVPGMREWISLLEEIGVIEDLFVTSYIKSIHDRPKQRTRQLPRSNGAFDETNLMFLNTTRLLRLDDISSAKLTQLRQLYPLALYYIAGDRLHEFSRVSMDELDKVYIKNPTRAIVIQRDYTDPSNVKAVINVNVKTVEEGEPMRPTRASLSVILGANLSRNHFTVFVVQKGGARQGLMYDSIGSGSAEPQATATYLGSHLPQFLLYLVGVDGEDIEFVLPRLPLPPAPASVPASTPQAPLPPATGSAKLPNKPSPSEWWEQAHLRIKDGFKYPRQDGNSCFLISAAAFLLHIPGLHHQLTRSIRGNDRRKTNRKADEYSSTVLFMMNAWMGNTDILPIKTSRPRGDPTAVMEEVASMCAPDKKTNIQSHFAFFSSTQLLSTAIGRVRIAPSTGSIPASLVVKHILRDLTTFRGAKEENKLETLTVQTSQNSEVTLKLMAVVMLHKSTQAPQGSSADHYTFLARKITNPSNMDMTAFVSYDSLSSTTDGPVFATLTEACAQLNSHPYLCLYMEDKLTEKTTQPQVQHAAAQDSETESDS